MRIGPVSLVAVCVVAGSTLLFSQASDAARVLSAAREALGGEQKLSAVKTFVATGRTRQLRGNNLVPIEFEINCELPDRFVRKDEIPAQGTDPSVTGFAGDTLLQSPIPAGRGGPPVMAAPPPGRGLPAAGDGAGRSGPVPNPGLQRLMMAKQEFARLMLGTFAMSFPAYPLTFTYAAVGEAPEGKADILDVAGPAGFTARFVVQQDTHLPVMLIWTTPGPARGGPPGAPPENRMYFADYRDVNGTRWPFRIRRAVGGDTVEETTFDRIRVNVRIDPKKFEAPK